MSKLEKVVYTAKTHTTGGRADGVARSDDGRLDIRLSPPTEPGGTNPEQLFAAGYSACFIGAIKAAAGRMKVTLPADLAVDAQVDLGPIPGAAFGIDVRMNVTMPGLDRAKAREVLDAAHRICPYSNATRGNIDVAINLV